MGKVPAIAAVAIAAAVILMTVMAADAGAQAIIPIIELAVEPATQEVDVSSGAASAVYNCSVFVEGLPRVPYRVNLTADCEGWPASCEPGSFLVTGNGDNSFRTTVSVPAGEPGGLARVLTVNATVSTTGVPLNTSSVYSVLTTKQSFGLKLSSQTTSLSVTAGKTVSWAFALNNSGNGRDTFSVSVVNLQTYTTNNWTLKFNRSLMSVDAGDTGTCTINITPDPKTKNQTVAFQIKAFSRSAFTENITVEGTLEMQLSVAAAPGGGGKTSTTPKGTPGMEALWLLLAMALAAMVGLLKRG